MLALVRFEVLIRALVCEGIDLMVESKRPPEAEDCSPCSTTISIVWWPGCLTASSSRVSYSSHPKSSVHSHQNSRKATYSWQLDSAVSTLGRSTGLLNVKVSKSSAGGLDDADLVR
jgi:hypothetical protein